MSCPRPDIDCDDCTLSSCVNHPDHEPDPRVAIPVCAKGDSCPLAQIVADFIRRLEEEEALRSGDVASWEWQALHEKGAGQ